MVTKNISLLRASTALISLLDIIGKSYKIIRALQPRSLHSQKKTFLVGLEKEKSGLEEEIFCNQPREWCKIHSGEKIRDISSREIGFSFQKRK